MRRGTRILLVAAMSVCPACAALAEDKPASQPQGGNGQVIRQQIQIRAGGGMQVQAGGGGASRSMSMSNQAGKVEFKEQDGDKHLVVKDADGKELFDGAVNTADERKKIPEAALAIIKVFRDRMPRAHVQVGIVADPNGGPAFVAPPVAMDNPFDEILGIDDKGGEEFSRRVGDYGVKVSVDKDGKHRAAITDKEKKVVFDGPTDTAEQWDKIQGVPADVVAEARKMDKNFSLSRERSTDKPVPASKPDAK